MNRPLVSVVLAYAAGLLLGQFVHPPLAALFAASFSILILALIVKNFRQPLLWLLFALAGWTNFAIQTQILSPQELRKLLPNEPELVTVRGHLAETPSQRVYVRDEVESWRTLARLYVTGLARGTQWQPASGQIIITTPGILPARFFTGQEAEITGIIAQPAAPVAEGLLDYRTYLRRQGIYFSLKTDSPEDWRLVSTNTVPPLSDRFLDWSQATLARGLPAVDEPLKLLWAMTLGWRPALTGEVSAPFMQSGTMHIFSISGLHIALIAGILVAILRAVQLPRFGSGLVIIPLIWFYTAATGWQPSAIRSTIMMTVVIGGWMLKRPSDLLNSLAAAGLIILVMDPLQLFQASFQLSFFVVLSIALFMPPLEKVRDRLLAADPLLPRNLLPRWRRWLYAAGRALLTSAAVSFAAWLGSWPLCAYYFHLFSPVTLLANLLVVPLSSAALACNLGSLAGGDWLPWATELFNHSGWLWMRLMVDISHAVIKLPHAFFYVRSPTAADFVIYYGALLAVLSGAVFKRKWRVPTIIATTLIAGFYGWRWHESRQITTLTVLPLNGGHAVFAQDVKSGNLLVDCGDTNSVEFITQPFLHGQGINHLPRLALTQGDLRDMGGALAVGEIFSVDDIFTSPVRFRSVNYRQTIAAFERQPHRHQVVKSGDAIGNWQVLYPAATDHFPQANDNSLVLKGEFPGATILLLSDLGRPGQEVLINQTNDLRADIVITGLPQKSQPISDGLLEKIQPQLVIVADSQFPATRRASRTLKERLEQREIPVIYTRTAGAVKIVTDKNGWKLATMDGQRFNSAASSRTPKHTAPAE
ncbi:MAG: ComEC/Rec2 family competence protein [Verrucomicrobiota bacterium]